MVFIFLKEDSVDPRGDLLPLARVNHALILLFQEPASRYSMCPIPYGHIRGVCDRLADRDVHVARHCSQAASQPESMDHHRFPSRLEALVLTISQIIMFLSEGLPLHLASIRVIEKQYALPSRPRIVGGVKPMNKKLLLPEGVLGVLQ